MIEGQLAKSWKIRAAVEEVICRERPLMFESDRGLERAAQGYLTLLYTSSSVASYSSATVMYQYVYPDMKAMRVNRPSVRKVSASQKDQSLSMTRKTYLAETTQVATKIKPHAAPFTHSQSRISKRGRLISSIYGLQCTDAHRYPYSEVGSNVARM